MQMTLEQFLYAAICDVHIVDGSDEGDPTILIIPSTALDTVIDYLSPALLNREVFSFEPKDKTIIKVFLKEVENKG